VRPEPEPAQRLAIEQAFRIRRSRAHARERSRVSPWLLRGGAVRDGYGEEA
jgi:hypothetical protein